MYAIKRRKEQWEFENREQLQRLISVVQDQSKRQTVRAARLIGFLLYLTYLTGGWLMCVLRILLVEPRIVRRVSFEKRPLERYEFEKPELNTHHSLWHK